MDVPVNVVEWELFVPEQFRVDHFDGDMFDAGLMPMMPATSAVAAFESSGVGGGRGAGRASGRSPLAAAQPGQINGRVVDANGMPIPGATVVIDAAGQKQRVTTDSTGAYVASNVPNGPVTLTGQLTGFATSRRTVQFNQGGQQVDMSLAVGGVTESVTVIANSPVINASQSFTQNVNNSRSDPQAKAKVENEAP